MNADLIKGHWHIVKGRVKQALGQLTHDELAKTEGDIEEVAGQIQKSVGESREQARRQLENLARSI